MNKKVLQTLGLLISMLGAPTIALGVTSPAVALESGSCIVSVVDINVYDLSAEPLTVLITYPVGTRFSVIKPASDEYSAYVESEDGTRGLVAISDTQLCQ